MARTFALAALTVGFLAFFLTEAGAQKKKNSEVAEFATDQDYKWLAGIKDMTGKLTSINTMSVTFRLDIPHMVPNPKYRPPSGNNQNYNQMMSLYRQQAQIMTTANPVVRQMRMINLLNSIQNQQYQQMLRAAVTNSNPSNQPFNLAHQYKDFDLDLADKVSVRKLYLETEYDDKGNVKTYTKDEKDQLRGKDLSKPGYTASIEDLQAGLHVKVYLKMPKKTKSSEGDKLAGKAGDQGKDADKDNAADKEAGKAKEIDKAEPAADKAKNKEDKAATKDEVVKPIITMIVILQSLDAPITNDTAPPKKKKDN